MIPLPQRFLDRPIAHRALHDLQNGRAENGKRAIEAAIAGNYAIEIDIQLSRDGVPMVFHDYHLDRLTKGTGAVAVHNSAYLNATPLRHDGGTIPTLEEVLLTVAGRVPLLIELKDQDGEMGPNIGPMGKAVADLVRHYEGDVALMSFNPHHVDEMAYRLPERPRGLVTDQFRADDWPLLPEPTRSRMRDVPDYDAVRASFISHNVNHLTSPRVKELKRSGAAVLCWTVRDAATEDRARSIVDNITFEGYTA